VFITYDTEVINTYLYEKDSLAGLRCDRIVQFITGHQSVYITVFVCSQMLSVT